MPPSEFHRSSRPGSARSDPRSRRLLSVLDEFDRLLIVMHDNPDPDAIATGWCVRTLLEERLNLPVDLVGGGQIVRAENRHMVDLLTPPIQLVSELVLSARTGVILVDCRLGSANHIVTREAIQPVAIIDHHVNGAPTEKVAFVDVRPDVAASATIAASYLQEQGIEPGEKLATAMLYAIRTETRSFETHYTELDRDVLLWLTERADPALLAAIESAPLSRDYFSDLAMAIQSTRVFGNTALCLLPRAEGAEIVGELADLLVRCRGIHRVLSGALVHGNFLVSVRTEHEGDSATLLVQKVLAGLGTGGGHMHRAGGEVSPFPDGKAERDALKEKLRDRWLDACELSTRQSEPLISRREIIENL